MDYDWPAIRAAWERGIGATEIARSIPQTPSRQAIETRAVKEGWSVARLPTETKELTDPRQIILARIRTGATFELAAAAAGISSRCLLNWRHDNPDFEELIKAQRAAYLAGKIGQIDEAGERDWKAAAYLLERANETRDQFGQKQDSGGVTIVLNVDRSQGISIDGKAIKHGE